MPDKGLSALLVEDDEDDFVIARDLFARIATPRVSLEWRATYEGSLAAMLEQRHDLYLLDYHLGARDGVELLREATRRGFAPSPILLLTAHDDPSIDALAAAAGASDYLVKGELTAPLLGRAVRYALARHHATCALRRRDAEKAVLLKEIHHRVKNNLQIITSLISLQSRAVGGDARDALLRAQDRVRSIALIHEHLYRATDLASVDMASYLDALVRLLVQSQSGIDGVRTAVRAEGIALPVDRAVPCGLVVNELFTNALKHAFRGDVRAQPEVVVELRPRDGGVALSVSDNGVGTGEGARNASGLGLQLVRALARQLGGELRVESREGTRCWIDFAADGDPAEDDGEGQVG